MFILFSRPAFIQFSRDKTFSLSILIPIFIRTTLNPLDDIFVRGVGLLVGGKSKEWSQMVRPPTMGGFGKLLKLLVWPY